MSTPLEIESEEENRYHVAASSAMTPAETYVLKHDDTFAVLDRFGDVSPEGRSEQGLYHGGTKFVSTLRLRVRGQRPLLLSSGMLENNLLQKVDLTNPDLFDEDHNLVVPYGTLHIACPPRGTVRTPAVRPFTNSSTRSRFVWHHTSTGCPSRPAQFQCGNRCSTGSLVLWAW